MRAPETPRAGKREGPHGGPSRFRFVGRWRSGHALGQGAAEIVAYLALNEDDLTVAMDENDQMLLEYVADDAADDETGEGEGGDRVRRVRLPKVTVTRR